MPHRGILRGGEDDWKWRLEKRRIWSGVRGWIAKEEKARWSIQEGKAEFGPLDTFFKFTLIRYQISLFLTFLELKVCLNLNSHTLTC